MAIDMDEGDWIPVFRKLRESWIWKDAETVRAWMDILMMANRRESKFMFRGAQLLVEPGQLATSYQSLAKRWGWSRARVQRFVAALAKDQAIELRRLEFVASEEPSGPPADAPSKNPKNGHLNVHVNGHVRATKTRTRTGTWKDSESDRSIALLTIVNSPVRTKWLAKRTREKTEERTPERSPETPPAVHLDGQKTLHNPRGREVETTTAGQGETQLRGPTAPPSSPVAARGVDDGLGTAVAVPEGGEPPDGEGVQETTTPTSPRDPLLGRVSGARGAELLEAVGMDPTVARSLALQRVVGEILDICVEARVKGKPAGHARRAIELGWLSPVVVGGPEVDDLVSKLSADAAALNGRFQRLTGGIGLLTNRKTERLPGESEEAFALRVRDGIQARRVGVNT